MDYLCTKLIEEKQLEDENKRLQLKEESLSLIPLLKVPLVFLSACSVTMSAIANLVLDPILEPQLRKVCI